MRSHSWSLVLIVALLAGSCSTEHASSPVAPADSPLVPPISPANSTAAVIGCWRDGAADRLATLLTDDYTFVFAVADSAGNAFHSRPWLREDELTSARHLLLGNGPHPRAKHLRLTFDGPVSVLADPRPGKDPRWHQEVDASTTLTLIERWFGPATERIVTGHSRFYLVRGDSAVIPPELAAQGWVPDSTRWWLQRWEDDTVPQVADEGPGAPVRHTSWGRLKVDYY